MHYVIGTINGYSYDWATFTITLAARQAVSLNFTVNNTIVIRPTPQGIMLNIAVFNFIILRHCSVSFYFMYLLFIFYIL